MTRRKLLVTTALESTWGSSDEILFLGEWCKRYERRDVWSRRASETVVFHWNDRGKLRRDYAYLETLHHSLLESLTESLNALHRVDHRARYWQTLLDPWLLSYVAVVFDRWESLRLAFGDGRELDVMGLRRAEQTRAPFSYMEFLNAAFSDEWNEALCRRIIESEYAGACVIRPAEEQAPAHIDKASVEVSPRRRSVRGRLVAIIDDLIRRGSWRCDVLFLGSNFSPWALIQLNLALGQLPRLFLREFGSVLSESDLPAPAARSPRRPDLRLAFQSESRFEEFIAWSIVGDLPRSVVEDYPALRDRARRIDLRPKVIVTAGSHWSDPLAKAWFAEQVLEGAKLVIAEHGGSLPSFQELFDFEVDIADVKGTWFAAYDPKHVQLPPPRLVGRFSAPRSGSRRPKDGGYCLVIGNECARWVHRAQFYPMANQWSISFDMVLKLYAGLNDDVKAAFRVKPYPTDQGWNTRQQFSDILGEEMVLTESSLDRVLLASRVLVCTYPETTFAEAMVSGVPTVLIYPEHLYELHPVALPLLDELRSANIVFHCPMGAASHLNRIWRDPYEWWDSRAVLHARAEFSRQAVDLDRAWVSKWTTFLSSFLA